MTTPAAVLRSGLLPLLLVAVPHAAPVAGLGAALLAQAESGGNPLFGMLSSGGVCVALIIVVQMFLKEMRESLVHQAEQTDKAFSRFEAKLDAIEQRHSDDESKRHETMRALIDRALESQERLAVTQERLAAGIGELRKAIDGLSNSTANNDKAIGELRAEVRSLRDTSDKRDAHDKRRPGGGGPG